jgi:hypothetical protein
LTTGPESGRIVSMKNIPMTSGEVEVARSSLKHWLQAEPDSILSDLVDRLCNTALNRYGPLSLTTEQVVCILEDLTKSPTT